MITDKMSFSWVLLEQEESVVTHDLHRCFAAPTVPGLRHHLANARIRVQPKRLPQITFLEDKPIKQQHRSARPASGMTASAGKKFPGIVSNNSRSSSRQR